MPFKGPRHAQSFDPKKGTFAHALFAARPAPIPGRGGPVGHLERAAAAPTVHWLPLRDEKRLAAVHGARKCSGCSASSKPIRCGAAAGHAGARG